MPWARVAAPRSTPSRIAASMEAEIALPSASPSRDGSVCTPSSMSSGSAPRRASSLHSMETERYAASRSCAAWRLASVSPESAPRNSAVARAGSDCGPIESMQPRSAASRRPISCARCRGVARVASLRASCATGTSGMAVLHGAASAALLQVGGRVPGGQACDGADVTACVGEVAVHDIDATPRSPHTDSLRRAPGVHRKGRDRNCRGVHAADDSPPRGNSQLSVTRDFPSQYRRRAAARMASPFAS